MKCRNLFILSLAFYSIAVANAAPSQTLQQTPPSHTQEEKGAPKSLIAEDIEPQSPLLLTQATAATPSTERYAILYELNYAPAKRVIEIAEQMLQLPPQAKMILSEEQNGIALVGSKDEHRKMVEIIRAFDVESEKPSPLPSNIAYRVYAVEIPLEIPSEKLMQQQFTACLKTIGENIVLSTSQLESSFRGDVRITELNCIQQNMGEYQLDINGTVSSMETFKNLITKLEQTIGTNVDIINTRFNALSNTESPQSSGFDNAFYRELDNVLNLTSPAGDVTDELNSIGYVGPPKNRNASLLSNHSSLRSMKKTLNNLLGTTLRVRGYWFGNSSLPGECTAPIGSWELQINTWSPDRPGDTVMGGMGMGMGGFGGGMMGNTAPPKNPSNAQSEFTMKISLKDGEKTILSNNVNARVGRPVIVGYTRHIQGQYVPGALVVIPEVEFSDVSN